MASAYQPPGALNQLRPVYANGYLPSYGENAAATQRLQANAAAGSGAPNTTTGAAAIANNIQANTHGRGDATMNDPYLTAALGRLSDIQSGKTLPFSDAVKSQMLSRHGDMASAAEASQARSLQEQNAANGGSSSDPSYRAAIRGMDQSRQAGNLAAAGEIDTQATLQNFQAQNDATRGIQAARLPQLGMANEQYNKGAAYDAQWTSDGEHQSGFQYQPAPLQAWPTQQYQAPSYQFQSAWTPPAQNQPLTQGSTANPVDVLQDPYGGQGPPAAPPFAWNPNQPYMQAPPPPQQQYNFGWNPNQNYVMAR